MNQSTPSPTSFATARRSRVARPVDRLASMPHLPTWAPDGRQTVVPVKGKTSCNRSAQCRPSTPKNDAGSRGCPSASHSPDPRDWSATASKGVNARGQTHCEYERRLAPLGSMAVLSPHRIAVSSSAPDALQPRVPVRRTAIVRDGNRAVSDSNHVAPRGQKGPGTFAMDGPCIDLGRGLRARVSEEDWPRVSAHRWHAHWNGDRWYARGFVDGRKVYLHRWLLNAPDGLPVDHKNRDGLDCRRENIRLATAAQNCANAVHPIGKSGFRGVTFHRIKRRWQAAIKHEGKRHRGAYRHEPEVAARDYDDMARRLHGPFARLNFPGIGERGCF